MLLEKTPDLTKELTDLESYLIENNGFDNLSPEEQTRLSVLRLIEHKQVSEETAEEFIALESELKNDIEILSLIKKTYRFNILKLVVLKKTPEEIAKEFIDLIIEKEDLENFSPKEKNRFADVASKYQELKAINPF